MGWIKQIEDKNLPEWLTSNLRNTCECGGQMENFYNDARQVTFRRCNNPSCPRRMAQKVVSMCDLLKVKGIGPETAYKIITENKLTNQYQALPFILKEKPTVSLNSFLRMSFTKGIDTKWSAVTEVAKTLDECYTKYVGEHSYTLKEIEPLLRDGLNYVNIAKPEADQYKTLITGSVMLSGSFRGFAEREDFIAGINMLCKGVVKLGVCGKRKTGVMALIQEADSPHAGKWQCAKENGIPIMTPDEFQEYIAKLVMQQRDKLEVNKC